MPGCVVSRIVVMTELRLLHPSERWPRLVAPLAEKLKSSGLGRILDLDTVRSRAGDSDHVEADELAVELANLAYGHDLLRSVVRAAGLDSDTRFPPSRWRNYHCDEYFTDGWSERGYFSEPAETWVIVPIAEAYEDTELEFLVVGLSGADGIDFGFRKGYSGVWAFYPIDHEFCPAAATVAELVDDWCSGQLRL